MPLKRLLWRGVLTIAMTSSSGSIASSVPARNPDQFFTCSSDRKRWMRLQVNGQFVAHLLSGTSTYPWIDTGLRFCITPSRTNTTIGSPQSRQGASIWIVLPGNTQQTARDSNPHCANHFWCPSMVMRYCVGRLLKGANDAIRSVPG